MLNGKIENRYKKFENDYWASSIHELIRHSKFEKGNIIKFGTCGANPEHIKNYFLQKGFNNFIIVHPDQADYFIMTNRVIFVSGNLTLQSTNESVKLTNCLDRYEGEDIFSVERNGVVLSVIRKNTKQNN